MAVSYHLTGKNKRLIRLMLFLERNERKETGGDMARV
jgi:hypothetical protein